MHRTTKLFLLAGLIGLCALQASASIPSTPSQALEGHAITLDDAVEITLRSHPSIEQARQSVEQRQAQVFEEAGVFDRVLTFDGKLNYDNRELIGTKLEQEENRRLRLDLISQALALTARQIADSTRGRPTLLFQLECAANQDRIVVDAGANGRFIICRNTQGEVVDIILATAQGGSVPPIQRLLRLIDSVRDDLRDDLEGLLLDQLRTVAFTLDLVSRTLRLQFERLGALPDEIQMLELDLLLSHQFRFRNGSSLTLSLSFNSTEENFADKPLAPGLGGSLVPNTFTTAAGLSLTFPLGKGRGNAAAEGSERAARQELVAAEQLLLHTASSQVLETVEAYWQLAAAQKRLFLLEQSLEVQRKIHDTVQELLEADEVTPYQLNRIDARIAVIAGQTATARQNVLNSRFALVDAMGLTADRLEHSPLAGEGLPGGFDDLDEAEAFILDALSRRHDLEATRRAIEASSHLAETARINLRHQIDLSLNVSYNGLYESFDERFYEPEGFLEAWQGKVAGPSYGIGLRWRIPLRNRAAKGRLTQARAALSRSEIMETDLERGIRLRVVELTESFERTLGQRAHLEKTLGYQQQALESSRELLRSSQITLIDLLLTEEQLTDARLALVDVDSRLAGLEAQLLFESGRLLDNGGSETDLIDWQLALLSPPGEAP